MVTIGILANPAAARDVRRLVARASSISIAERCAIVQRALTGLGAVGIDRVLMMFDRGGIVAGLKHAIEHHRRDVPLRWPELEILEMPVTGEAEDTLKAVRLMRQKDAKVIMVLGGDGTHRLVAHECGTIPLVCISTGTNNVFPEFQESTVAGIAAGAVAKGVIDRTEACRQNKRLGIRVNGQQRIGALIDICITSEKWIGSRAVWRTENLRELYLTFAEPDAIGLSSIGGLLKPVGREEEEGLVVELGPCDTSKQTLEAPIAPGLIEQVGINVVRSLVVGEPCRIRSRSGTVALDGEKEIEFTKNDIVEIGLDREGPLTVDVSKVMKKLAKKGRLS